jgi:hypothetical protein
MLQAGFKISGIHVFDHNLISIKFYLSRFLSHKILVYRRRVVLKQARYEKLNKIFRALVLIAMFFIYGKSYRTNIEKSSYILLSTGRHWNLE